MIATCKWNHTEAYVFTDCAKGVKQMWRVGWIYIHVLMHVYTLIKGGPEDWEMHVGPYRDAYVCVQLCKRDGADMGSQMDMHSCTNACTFLTKVQGQVRDY